MLFGYGAAAIAFSARAAALKKAGLQKAGFAHQLAKPGKSLSLFGGLAGFCALEYVIHNTDIIANVSMGRQEAGNSRCEECFWEKSDFRGD